MRFVSTFGRMQQNSRKRANPLTASWFPSPRFSARSTTTRTRRRASSSRWSPNALHPPPPHSIPIPGRSYTRNVATAFPTITARWLNAGGVLADRQILENELYVTSVARTSAGASIWAALGIERVLGRQKYTQNELRGVLVCFTRGGHAQIAIPRRACLFCNWRQFDDVR